MDTQQIIIKSVLIAVVVIAAIVIIFPGRGARGQAIQRLFWLGGLLVGLLAIIFPALTTMVANWLGIGRGVDLVLYLLIIFFVAYVIATSVHSRKVDRTTTVLARKLALMEAELRRTGVLRFESTEAHGGEPSFDLTGPIEVVETREEPGR